MSKRAFIFPGQGAQYVGMGRSFYDNYPIAKELFEQSDDLLKMNLSKIIFEGPEDKLTETCNSQLGIFVTSMAILRTVQSLCPDLKADVAAGLSLGEYTALVAAERLKFEDALLLVRDRGSFMHEACLETVGSMAVVLGLSADAVDAACRTLNMPNDLWVANYNSPGQIVISGTPKGVEVASAALLTDGAKRVQPLKVAGAFHSGLMKSAARRLKESLQAVSFKEGPIEIVMNVPGDFVSEIPSIPALLEQQVYSSVRWEQGVKKMEGAGVEQYIEMGCGRVLAGLNRKICKLATTTSIEKVEDLEKLAG